MTTKTRTKQPHIEAALAFAASHVDLRDDVARARKRGMSPLEAVAAYAHLRREVLMPAVDEALREKTESEDATSLRADVLVVGGGPLGAALSARLAERGHDVLVVDDGDGGGAFARYGAGFRLNTPSALHVDAQPGVRMRDDDDLHPGLALRLSTLSPARFPSGAVLGDAARITLATSAARLRCVSRVVSLTRNDDDGVEVQLADGVVHAKQAIFCTGFGTARDHSQGDAVLSAQRALADATSDALPLAWMQDARSIAVIGAGPSALSVWALALGFAPYDAIERPGALARAHTPRELTWVTGAHGPTSARDARDRMRVAAPHTMAFVIQQAIAPVLDELVRLEAAGRLRVVRGRATWSVDGARGKVRIDVGDAHGHLDVDRAVCATGFVSTLPRIFGAPSLRALVDDGRARMLDVVDGAPSALRVASSLVMGAALEELVPHDFDEPPFAGAYLRALPIIDALPVVAARRQRMTRARLQPGKRGSARIDVERAFFAEAHAYSSWTNALDVRLALASFDVRALGTRRLVVSLRTHGRAQVNVDVTGLDARSAQLLANALPQRLRRAARRWGSLELHVDIRNGRAQ